MRKQLHRLPRTMFALLPVLLFGSARGAMAQVDPATVPPAAPTIKRQLPQHTPPAGPQDTIHMGPDGRPVAIHHHTLTINTRPGQAKIARAKPMFGPQPKQAAGAEGVRQGKASLQPFGSKGERVSIAFNNGDFVPPVGEKLDPHLAALTQVDTLQANASVHALILLNGRLDAQTSAFLAANGVQRLGFYPHAAYLVRIPTTALNAVAALPSVRWVGQPTIAQKLAPELRSMDAVTAALTDNKLKLVVSFYGPDEDNTGRNALQAVGAHLGYYDRKIAIQTVELDASQLYNLARLDSVLYIEPVRTGHTTNVFGMSTINADWLWGNFDPASDNTATPVKVGLLDTGFYVYHQDFSNLFVGNSILGYSLIAGENWYDDLGHHGTHVAGTMVGEGNADSRYRGVAAGLTGRNNSAIPDFLVAQVFDKTGHGNGTDLINGLDLLDLGFSSGYQRQVENFSGGGYGSSGSDPEARKVDSVYGDGVLVCVAAGNNGPGTVGTPGDAKGALTVGAIYNNTELGTFTDNITGYSAVGPTSNGIHKPDVVSPGSYVDSTLAGTSNGYLYDWEGTSMATPHVAGLAAGMIGHFGMPAWAVKSTLMANGIDLGYNRDTQGLGKVDAMLNHYGIDGSWTVHWASNSGTGDVQYFDVHLTQAEAALRIVMTYPDPPSAAGASSILVNDLDLYVQYSVDGSTLTTDRSGTWADTGVDPVSVVQLSNTAAGYYRIKMYSYNVSGSQAWAATARWVDSTLNPNIYFNVSVPYAVQPNSTFNAMATATSGGYVASGVVGSIAMDSGLDLTGVHYFRQSKPSSSSESMYFPNPWSSEGYYEVPNINMGDIASGYSRQLWWTLAGTTEGTKNVTFSVASVNGGSGSTSGTVIVDGTPPQMGAPQSQNWNASLDCDVTCTAQDTLSGLDPSTAYYRYSTDGGSTWTGYTSTSCTGAYASTSSETITAYGVPFGKNSTSLNKIEFAVADAASNFGYSAITGVSTPTPKKLSISPSTVVGGLSATGTVTLSGAAPTGGATVTLTNTNTAAVVPSSVTVAGGASSATFPITTSLVTATKTGTVKGTYGGVTASATLTVRRISVASLTLNPTTVVGGVANATGTVTLDETAPTGGITVTLTSSKTTAASVPSSITIAAGTISNTFTVTSHTVTSYTSATITASANGLSKTAALIVAPKGTPTFTLTPTSVIGGVANATGKITLPGGAQTGGMNFTLTRSNTSAVSVPSSVTIAAGATSATFTVTSHKVTASTSETITANSSAVSLTAKMTVLPDAILSLTLSPTSVHGGSANSTGTVTLQAAAPTGGVVISLSSSKTTAGSVPSSITIPAGATTGTFTVTSHTVAASTTATITATSGGASKTAVLTVTH